MEECKVSTRGPYTKRQESGIRKKVEGKPRKMTREKVIELRKEREEQGTPFQKLAEKYGISEKTTRDIWNRIIWADV